MVGRSLAALAALTLSGCYCSHRAPEPDIDAGPPDAGARIDAFVEVPDAGPPLACETIDVLALAEAIEARADLVGLDVEGEPRGAGTVRDVTDGVATIDLDDGRVARFGASPEILVALYPGHPVTIARRDGWDVARAGDRSAAVHVAPLGASEIPRFEVTEGISRHVDFALVPGCAGPLECSGPATGEAYALAVFLFGDRGFLLGPGDTGREGGGIDTWTVRFEGAARVDEGEGACPAATGLHAIVEVAYEELCICTAPRPAASFRAT